MQNGAQISSAMVLRQGLRLGKAVSQPLFLANHSLGPWGAAPLPSQSHSCWVKPILPPFERGIHETPFPVANCAVLGAAGDCPGCQMPCHKCWKQPSSKPSRLARQRPRMPGGSPVPSRVQSSLLGLGLDPLVPCFVTTQACVGGRAPQLRSPKGLHRKEGGGCCHFVLGVREACFLCS